jgi:uncharacterized membrane protein YfcA
MDLGVALAGLLTGLAVGLTGMGGGALMTPVLVLVFGVDPLAAVSTDVVASLVLKPVGGTVHARRGTVHRGIVTWLSLGSVPAAFVGVLLLLRSLGRGAPLAERLQELLGVTLLVAASALAARSILRGDEAREGAVEPGEVAVRPGWTLLVGVVGGLVVGMTSVGAGSLMMVLLLGLYPTLSARALVGTDLVQAIPLGASAAAGHLLWGDVRPGLTLALLAGGVPGVWAGATLSSRAPDRLVRPLLLAVLVASALRLLDAPTPVSALVGLTAGAAILGAGREAGATAAGGVAAVRGERAS